MSKSTLLGTFALVFSLALVPAENAAYTLDGYVKKVALDNPELSLSRQNVASAEESVKQARAALLPGIGVSGNYVRNLEDITAPAPVASRPSGGPLVYQDVDQNRDNELTLSLGISQKILDPQSIARFELARKNRTIQASVDEYKRRDRKSVV